MRILNILCDAQDSGLSQRAADRLREEGYDIDIWQFGTSDIDSNEKYFAEAVMAMDGCSLAVVRVHAGLTYFKKFERLKDEIAKRGISLIVESEMPDDIRDTHSLFLRSESDYVAIRSYIELGGDENEYGLYTWILRNIGNVDIDVKTPERNPAQGYYLPGRGVVDSVQITQGEPSVAVLIGQNNVISGNMKHIDALISAIGSKGCNVIPVFITPNPNTITGSIGINESLRRYLFDDGRPTADAIVNTLPFSQLCLSDPGDGTDRVRENIFAELNVPVIQAVTMFSDAEGWKNSISGLGPYELSMSIFWPEYDGQIISVPLASTEKDADGRSVSMPIPDRVDAIAELAFRWAELKNTPVSKRKIAILLHQNPPRADMIGGAFGLDAQESTVRLLRAMRRRGYIIGNMPSTGKGMTKRLLEGVSNDSEWLSSEDMMERAAAKIPRKEYSEWFSKIGRKNASDMVRDWGNAPGDLNSVDGTIVVPGFVEGNVFVGLQPNRGMTEDCVDIYHSQDITPPHSYLAFYRWLTEDFGAQAVIHMGCHGTLEWLPGKGTGLSSECYPDLVFGHIPHLYPYTMSNTGEGVHAKRRNGAVVVDHLIPPLMRAGNYDDLLDIESNLQEYLRAKSADMKEKMSKIAFDLLEGCRKISILDDIGLPADCTAEQFEAKTETLFDYICAIKDNLIKNGLHILGEVPKGESMQQMVYSLTRVCNGDIPSMREAAAEAMGYDLDALISDASKISEGVSNGEIIDRIDRACTDFIEKMSKAEFDAEKCKSISDETFGTEPMRILTEAICTDYVPKLRCTSDEMKNLLDALDGRYVPPGPSGCITRGNAHLLPSGRNFYSIDPASIPTRSSWDTGMKMADKMIERHSKETGSYPKQVGIVIWATDTMKTGGDDIAYVLYLLGLRPVWSSNGGAVTGLEIIPVSELGRPRIDVTLRISGLFRDSFPNLVEMIDGAVQRISELDESDEDNYLLAHLRKDVTDSIMKGMDPLEARRKASVRIFGDPPGNYGGGVDSLIATSQWSDRSELADAYVEWGGYAYGKGLNGADMKDYFRRRMSEVDITVKNHESRELDAFDNDDDYVFLGGMNAAVESCKGEQPMSVIGDSSDPSSLKVRTLAEEGKFIYRSRVLNPKWLEGLKDHGYRGVQEVTNLVEFSFGWDSTSDTVEDWMYQSVTDRFILNEENRQWIQDNNPDALRQITSRLLEAVERGMWEADDETVEALKSIFLDTERSLEQMNDH